MRGKHEPITVNYTIQVSGTPKAVYDFGAFLNAPKAFTDHGVTTAVVASELLMPIGKDDR